MSPTAPSPQRRRYEAEQGVAAWRLDPEEHTLVLDSAADSEDDRDVEAVGRGEQAGAALEGQERDGLASGEFPAPDTARVQPAAIAWDGGPTGNGTDWLDATNWVGDAVMSLPALRALRGRFPHAHIAILAKPWVSDLYHREPFCDEMIFYTPKTMGERLDAGHLGANDLTGS